MVIFLGIVLASAAVAVTIGVVAENSAPASLSVFGQHVPAVTSQAQVFVAGVVVAIFVVVGLAISSLGMGRSMRVRRELRDLREEHHESLTTLEMEKQQLQRELARARSGAAGVPTAGDIPVSPRPTRDRDPVSPFFDQSA
jgi:uncharacterized protein HemX